MKKSNTRPYRARRSRNKTVNTTVSHVTSEPNNSPPEGYTFVSSSEIVDSRGKRLVTVHAKDMSDFKPKTGESLSFTIGRGLDTESIRQQFHPEQYEWREAGSDSLFGCIISYEAGWVRKPEFAGPFPVEIDGEEYLTFNPTYAGEAS